MVFPSVEMPPEVEALYFAVKDYVEAKGGELYGCDGVQVQEWSEDGSGKFRVAIMCRGTVPEYAEAHP